METPHQLALLEIAIEAGSGEKLIGMWQKPDPDSLASPLLLADLKEVLGTIRKKATAALNGEEPPRRGRPRKDRSQPHQSPLPMEIEPV